MHFLTFIPLPCVCHMLATVIRHTLQLSDLSNTILPMKEDDVQMEQLNKIRETVSAIKNVIAFLKRSGLSEKILTGLKQSNGTRWNSTFVMLKSSYDHINKFKMSYKSTTKKTDCLILTVLFSNV